MKKEISRFLILVPHRDSLRPLEEYRSRLFAAGVTGAFSFPMAAPLAVVSRSLNRDELKELGRNIRDLTVGNDGKIHGSGSICAKFTTNHTNNHKQEKTTENTGEEESFFFGISLNLPIEEAIFPQTARAKILEIFSPPVLCATLLSSREKPPSEEGPLISFRPASLANLVIQLLESGARPYSLEWKIGPLIWLPKCKGCTSLN